MPDMNPVRPLAAAQCVVAAGARSQQLVQRRLLTLLLWTSRDEALPSYGRSVCLEHTAAPHARLQPPLRQAAHNQVDLPPRVDGAI